MENNIVLVKSYFSRDFNSLDGYYKVSVPKNHKNDYKTIICEAGEMVEGVLNGEIESADDIEINPTSVLKRDDFERMGERMGWYSDGCTLSDILDALGWNYEFISFETFDADLLIFE